MEPQSGQVTAGVLRGQKSRFQLFGDTVNTASRMESTGTVGRIQISQSTADLLIAAGKMHWLTIREDKVNAKGKGELTTFWLDPRKRDRQTAPTGETLDLTNFSGRSEENIVEYNPDQVEVRNSLLTDSAVVSSASRQACAAKYRNLIDLNTDILLDRLVECVKWRQSVVVGSRSVKPIDHGTETIDTLLPYETMSDLIVLPQLQSDRSTHAPNLVDLSNMREILHMFVTDIAAMYNGVEFHSFEHASHVVLASNQLLKSLCKRGENETDKSFFGGTFGLGDDPLSHFAVVFAAFIHDVGHSGVPNSQLVVEEAEVALKYRNKSVAEQNSFVLAWKLLMEPKYRQLRANIYTTNVERKRFRQVVTNCIMATDIADPDALKYQGKQWQRAFGSLEGFTSSSHGATGVTRDEMNRKATVVLEMIVQAADISHTMQDFAVYLKWNERLFHEMSRAYMSGRGSFDPAMNWYQQELEFFDNFVLPLSRRLHECGIFGSHFEREAKRNRKEWEEMGRKVVLDMMLQLQLENQDGAASLEDEDSIMEGSSFGGSVRNLSSYSNGSSRQFADNSLSSLLP